MKQIFSDAEVRLEEERRAEKVRRLKTPITESEASDAIKKMDLYELQKLVNEDTILGEYRKAREGDYGFIGEAFVHPGMSKTLAVGDRYAALVKQGPKGPRALRVAPLETYIEWHRAEILERAAEKISSENAETATWEEKALGRITEGWERRKQRALAAGFQLVRIVEETISTSYGGRGVDTYEVVGSIDLEGAYRLLDAIGGRHEESGVNTPTEHGSDTVTLLTSCTFQNRWVGPWTD
jgi:hypothetical protein